MKPQTKRGLLLLASLAWSLRYDYFAALCVLAAALSHSADNVKVLLTVGTVGWLFSWVPWPGGSLRWRAYCAFGRSARRLRRTPFAAARGKGR